MRTVLSASAAVVLLVTLASAQSGTGQAGTAGQAGQAAQPAQTGTSGSAQAADEAAIRRIGEQYASAWNSGNATQAASVFTEDGTFTEVTGETHKGRSAIERNLAQDEIGSDKTGMKLSVQTDSIRFLQPDLAVATGTTEFTSVSGKGTGGEGHYMTVVKKVGGEWKVAAVHAAVDAPLATPAGAQPTGTAGTMGTADTAADEAAIRDLGHEWEKAAMNKDVDRLGRIYHEEFTEIDPAGVKRNKQEALNAMRQGDLTFESFEPSDIETRIYGNTAVVTGLSDVKAKHMGQDVSGKYRWTDTYIKEDGEWKVVATQITRVMEAPQEK